MHRSGKWIIALLAIGVALLFWGIDRYRHRFVRSNSDLFRFVPERNDALFFADVAAMRHTGLIGLFAPVESSDPEYREFVKQTGFDFTRDVDALAGAYANGRVTLLVRGRFRWDRLNRYARSHSATGNPQAGQFSFAAVQSDVLALTRATSLHEHAVPSGLPAKPVWLRVSHSLLENPSTLPLALRLFAVTLQTADPVVLSISPAATGLTLTLDAQLPSAAAADTVRAQLQIDTRMLALEASRARIQPQRNDLLFLLTSGAFQTEGNRVTGAWPVSPELIRALE